LTKRAARHLQAVCLLITAPPDRTRRLKSLTAQAVDLLMAERRGKLIARLDIHVCLGYPIRKFRQYSWWEHENQGYGVRLLEVGLSDTSGRIKIGIMGNELEAPEPDNMAQAAIEGPLMRVRGCEKVSLSGQLHKDFVERFLATAILDEGQAPPLADRDGEQDLQTTNTNSESEQGTDEERSRETTEQVAASENIEVYPKGKSFTGADNMAKDTHGATVSNHLAKRQRRR
jgi:hypothetical protein